MRNINNAADMRKQEESSGASSGFGFKRGDKATGISNFFASIYLPLIFRGF